MSTIRHLSPLVLGLCVIAACGGADAGEATVGSSAVPDDGATPQVVTLTSVTTAAPAPRSTDPTVGDAAGPPVAMLLRGVIVGASSELNGTRILSSPFPPRSTPGGVIVEGGQRFEPHPIRLATPGGSVLIGTGFGSAVDGGGTRVV